MLRLTEIRTKIAIRLVVYKNSCHLLNEEIIATNRLFYISTNPQRILRSFSNEEIRDLCCTLVSSLVKQNGFDVNNNNSRNGSETTATVAPNERNLMMLYLQAYTKPVRREGDRERKTWWYKLTSGYFVINYSSRTYLPMCIIRNMPAAATSL